MQVPSHFVLALLLLISSHCAGEDAGPPPPATGAPPPANSPPPSNNPCADTPCQNSGTCVLGGTGGFTCTCAVGWEGDTCTTSSPPDPCADTPCQNSGACVPGDTGGFTCMCAVGWEGDTCTTSSPPDPCADTPCQNSGICVPGDTGGFTCTCAAGWEGDTCTTSTVDPCETSPCLNGATCKDDNGAAACDCVAGFVGVKCDTNVDECDDNTQCQNGADCVDGINVFTCNCTSGWMGDLCDQDIDECTGTDNPHNCDENAECINTDGSFTCTCKTFYSGNGTSCTYIDPCDPSPCLNGASCTDNSGVHDCACVDGFTGDTCQTNTDECEGNTQCQNGAACVDGINGFTCDCTLGWMGDSCDQDIDECTDMNNPHNCDDNANCTNTAGSFTCTCKTFYSGDGTSCTYIDPCDPSPCLNGASCTDDNGVHDCACVEGFTGDTCQTNIDDCDGNTQCLNGADCVDGINDFTCNCTSGWMGDLCDQDIDECTDTTHTHDCDVHATCTNSDGSYNCTCNVAYTGDGRTCTFVSSCAEDTCGQGQCESLMSGYECLCYTGWTGNNCNVDINECENSTLNTCVENEVCVNTNGSYECQCAENFWSDGSMCHRMMLYNPMMDFGASFSGDGAGFGPVYVEGGFPFFGKLYHDIFVSSNGYLSLGSRFTLGDPLNTTHFPADVPMVAPYWLSLSGTTYVNQYDTSSNQSNPVVGRIFTVVKDYAASQLEAMDFQPRFIMVVTWNRMVPYPEDIYGGKQNVTFQVALATDGQGSLVVYDYDREHMLLDPRSANWTIGLGHSDGGDNVEVVPTDDILRPDLSSNMGEPGRFIYGLGGKVENPTLPCLAWHDSQNWTQIEAVRLEVDACPCTAEQAALDTRYMVYTDAEKRREMPYPTGGEHCYVLRFSNIGHPYAVCCYDMRTSALLVGPPGGSHVVLATDMLVDYNVCCVDVKMCHIFYWSRPLPSCTLYKPPGWGAGWGDPHITTLDTYTYTYNRAAEYDILQSTIGDLKIQGRAELAVNPVTNEVFNGTTFTAFALKGTDMLSLEVRLDMISREDFKLYINGTYEGTIFKKNVIMSREGLDVVMKGDEHYIVAQYRNGVSLTVGMAMKALWFRLMLPDNYKNTTTGLLGNFDGDPTSDLVLRNMPVNPGERDEVEIAEFTVTWKVQSAEESIFNYAFDGVGASFADYNKVDQEPMFFDAMISDLSAVEGIDVALAREVCGDHRPCLVDYIASKNINLGNWTKMQDMKNHEFGKILANQPPVFENTSLLLKATVGEMMTLQLRAMDPDSDQPVTYGVDTDLPDSMSMNASTGEFSWTPGWNLTEDGATFVLKFYATDTDGAKTIYWPAVDINPCVNGAPLVNLNNLRDFTYSPTNIYVHSCMCHYGYMGRWCQTMVDMCRSPCAADVTCVKGDDDTYSCGDCPPGMMGSGQRCYDEDECVTGEAGCQQECQNLRGSYQCLCDAGYALDDDNMSCNDMDECTLGVPYHDCMGTGEFCENTIGSYICQCKAGYFRNEGVCQPGPRQYGGQLTFNALLMPDGALNWQEEMADKSSPKFRMVAGVVENMLEGVFSEMDGFIAARVYDIREGSMIVYYDLYFDDDAAVNGSTINDFLRQKLEDSQCMSEGPDCHLGDVRVIDIDRSMAGDKDLCVLDADNDCDLDSTHCSTDDGRFNCHCRDGFRRWMDYTNICQDTDECDMGMHGCNNLTSVCVNIAGSFQCECRFGHRQAGNNTCVDVCVPNPCLNDGECMQQESSFTCKCQGIWDGPKCEDKNEEAIKFQNIAIGVGVGIGVICVILIIILIVAVCRRRRRRKERSFSPRPASGMDKYYSSGGRGEVDHWNPSGAVAAPPPNRARHSGDYEMKENGSGDSLMDDNVRYQPASRPPSRNQSRPPSGVENPSYAPADDDIESNKAGTPDYF